MQQSNFNYPALLEEVNDLQDPAFKEIKEAINHYERLGMHEAVKTAREGAVAYILKKSGLKLLFVDYYKGYGDFEVELPDGTKTTRWFSKDLPCRNTIRELYTMEVNGAKLPIHHSEKYYWTLTELKDYKKPVPIDILRKLPTDAKNKAVIFDLREYKDPILAYPIRKDEGSKQLIYVEKERIFRRDVTMQCRFKIPSPYFAGIFAWE